MSNDKIIAVTMPKWGLSMTEGKVMEWLVEEGTELNVGDPVVDIETEKIANTFEALDPGILRKKVAGLDDILPIGALLAVLAPSEVSESEIDAFVSEFLENYVPPEPEEEDEEESAYQYIDANGYRLRYSKMGTGVEKIILIHGFGGDADRWLFTQQPLSEKATVYAFDLPGHGQSSKSVNDGTVSGLAETVIALMDSLDITEARLIGHSLGGAIALQAAISYPTRVTRLDLIAPAGLGKEINVDYINGFIETDNRKEMKGLLQQLVADPELVNRALVNDMLQFKRTDGVSNALSQIAAGFIDAEGRQCRIMREEAALLTIPINLIWGSLDKIIPADHARDLPAQIKSTVLDGYGHLVQLEASTEVNAVLAL